MVAEQAPLFGILLMRARKAAGLTQEQLAERAHLSKRGISDLERGARLSPRKDTFDLLVQALELSVDERKALAAAARRGSGETPEPSPGLHADIQPAAQGSAHESALPPGGYLGAEPLHAVVGRERELTKIDGALQASLRREGILLVLEGEPGVGKTRLAQEAMLQARRAGMLTMVGRCYEEQRTTPYFPLLEVISDAWQAASARLRKEAQARYAEIGRLLPALLTAPPTLQDEDGRQRLMGAVTGFLSALVVERPLALLLDDLQWADSASIALVAQLARRLHGQRVFFLGAYRDVEVNRLHPLEAMLGALARERLIDIVTIRRLDAQGTAALLADRLQMPAAPAALTAIVHQRSDGNPFFTEELLATLTENGNSARYRDEHINLDMADLELPRSVRAVIGHRLSALPLEAQELLQTASVLGQDFELPVLMLVAGQAEEQVFAGLEAALRLHIVEVRGTQQAERYAFTHALIAQTLYEELPRFRQRRMHRRAAEALLQAYGDRPEQCAGIARQFLAGGDDARAAHYLERAGDHAARLYAPEEAISQYRAAVELLAEDGNEVNAAKVRNKLGDQLRIMLRLDEARKELTAALPVLEAAGEREELATTHCLLGLLHYWQHEGLAAQTQIMRALEVWPSGKVNGDLVRILTNAAIVASANGDLQAVSALMERALTTVEGLGDGVARSRVLAVNLALKVSSGETMAEIAEIGAEALSVAQQAGSLISQANVHLSMGWLRTARGEYERGRADLDLAANCARRACSPHAEINVRENQCAFLLLQGRWRQARLADKRIVDLQPQSSWPQVSLWLSGSFDQALQASRSQIALLRRSALAGVLRVVLAFDGYCRLQLGRVEEAEEAALEADDLMRRAGFWGHGWLISGLLAEAAALRKAPNAWDVLAEAERVMDRYEQHALRPQLLRVRGLLLADERRVEEALGVLGESAAIAREQQVLPELAGTLRVLSAVARTAGQERMATDAEIERKAIVERVGPEARGLVWAENA